MKKNEKIEKIEKATVKAVCTDCGGTGLYEGMCKREGYPVVCLRCKGSGCQIITYQPFVERRILKNVKGVTLSKGRFIFSGDAGAIGETVSYQDFLAGKLKYKERGVI
jgi:hypothetical protein